MYSEPLLDRPNTMILHLISLHECLCTSRIRLFKECRIVESHRSNICYSSIPSHRRSLRVSWTSTYLAAHLTLLRGLQLSRVPQTIWSCHERLESSMTNTSLVIDSMKIDSGPFSKVRWRIGHCKASWERQGDDFCRASLHVTIVHLRRVWPHTMDNQNWVPSNLRPARVCTISIFLCLRCYFVDMLTIAVSIHYAQRERGLCHDLFRTILWWRMCLSSFSRGTKIQQLGLFSENVH